MKLHLYKEISFDEGYDYFINQLRSKYPGTNLNQKYFVIYKWDSLRYDYVHRNQMKVLDSIAYQLGSEHIDNIFVSEMERRSSEDFLQRNFDSFPNSKLLYNMDDFISSLYSLNGIKLATSEHNGDKSNSKIDDSIEELHRLKQPSLYLIIDAKGKVLYSNGDIYVILKDSIFLNALNSLSFKKKLLNN